MPEFTTNGLVRHGFGFYNPNHAAAFWRQWRMLSSLADKRKTHPLRFFTLRIFVVAALAAIPVYADVPSKDLSNQRWEARLREEYNIAAELLGIPTNGTNLANCQSLFQNTNIVECGKFSVEEKYLIKDISEKYIVVSDKNNNRFATGYIYETATYLRACVCAAHYCFSQTSMVARHYALGLRLRKDIGDFCIHRRESGDDPDRLCFVRGHMMVHLRKGQAYNGSLVEIAKAIDEAILADAEECRKANGKDGSQ